VRWVGPWELQIYVLADLLLVFSGCVGADASSLDALACACTTLSVGATCKLLGGLADQSAVLRSEWRAQGTSWRCAVALWHVARAIALAVALRTAEVSRETLNANGLLVALTTCLWISIMGGVALLGSRQGSCRHGSNGCELHSFCWNLLGNA